MRPILTLFFRPNVFETDTETFFRDQIFSRPIPRLFFETKIFETETDTLKKLRKVSIPRSLETRCHTLGDIRLLMGKVMKKFLFLVGGAVSPPPMLFEIYIGDLYDDMLLT